jgi:hypothetical protein
VSVAMSKSTPMARRGPHLWASKSRGNRVTVDDYLCDGDFARSVKSGHISTERHQPDTVVREYVSDFAEIRLMHMSASTTSPGPSTIRVNSVAARAVPG